MSVDIGLLVEGMTVVANGGEEVGRVKEVRAADFVLDMSMRRDVFVPFGAIQEVGGTVVLAVSSDEIGDQDWEPVPLFGGTSDDPDNSETQDVDTDNLVVGVGDPAERGTWSASSDSYSLDPLDTSGGRQAIEGTDDGERPRSGDTTELEKLRDMSG